MSVTTTDHVYTRRAGTLWRDTGVHVLALPEGGTSDVVVLGGGGAMLWRLLDLPMTLGEVLEHLAVDDESTAAEVTSCLDDLISRGLVEGTGEEA